MLEKIIDNRAVSSGILQISKTVPNTRIVLIWNWSNKDAYLVPLGGGEQRFKQRCGTCESTSRTYATEWMFRWWRARGEESSVRWKCGYCRPVESFGSTWFLETLLPSGRKHRAPDYERAPAHFSRTIRLAPRKLSEDSWWEDSLPFRCSIFYPSVLTWIFSTYCNVGSVAERYERERVTKILKSIEIKKMLIRSEATDLRILPRQSKNC